MNTPNLFPPENIRTILDDGVAYLHFQQPGGDFFACSIRADQIVNSIEIIRRSEHPDEGIQRDDNSKRVNEISQYAETEDAIFPTPIIVSARSEDFSLADGILKKISGKPTIGHVLDGQHRLLGLKNTSLEIQQKINLLIVFAFDIDKYAEASIFATINGNQRQVSKSLMYDLFSLRPGRSVEKSCHEIVKSLNTDPESPFFRRIKILGRKADELETLSQAAFVDHVSQLMKKESSPLHDFYSRNEDWAIRRIITNYFHAIENSFINCEKDNILQENYFYKTTGFGGVIKALYEITEAGVSKGTLSINWLYPITKLFADNFKMPTGVGNSAMLDVKNQMIKALNEVNQPNLGI